MNSYLYQGYLRLSEYIEVNENSNTAFRLTIPSLYPLPHPHTQAYSIWYSQTVNHLSTLLALEIIQEAVFERDIPGRLFDRWCQVIFETVREADTFSRI